MPDYLNGISTAPGRDRTFLEHPEKGTSPHSCVLTVYKNDLFPLIKTTALDLKGGAGEKVVLNNFQKRTPVKPTWSFYLSPAHPDYEKMTSLQERYYTELDEVTEPFDVYISVEDSMLSSEGVSIIESWNIFIESITKGLSVCLDLSKLRPAGDTNDKGLVATGPVGYGKDNDNHSSFWAVYYYIAQHLEQGDIYSLIQLLGCINDTLRRGGFKRGIVCSSLNYNHPDFMEYITCDITKIPGSHKKAVSGLDKGVLEHEDLVQAICDATNSQGIFWERFFDDDRHMNVCVTEDTWVDTSQGAKQVKDLINTPFMAKVDGLLYPSEGFWSNGFKETIEVETENGFKIQLTENHQLLKAERKGYDYPYQLTWVDASALNQGDRIKINDNQHSYRWDGGNGTEKEGWILGFFVGDGTFHDESGIIDFKGDAKIDLYDQAVEYLKSETPALVSSYNSRVYDFAKTQNLVHITSHGRDHHSLRLSTRRLKLLANKFGVYQGHKQATNEIEQASFNFCVGFIRGFLDADGCVFLGNPDGSGRSIQVQQTNKETLEIIQRILLRMGINSNIWSGRNGGVSNFPGGEYQTKPAFRLDVTGDNIARYRELIGFDNKEKSTKLDTLLNSYNRKPYKDKFIVKVKSVKALTEKEVFDCTVEEAHCFSANGIIAHNCIGIRIRDRGTCLIWRENLGLCATREDVVSGKVAATLDLCKLHVTWRDKVDQKSPVLELEKDNQIGVDVLGLANMLRIWGVTYKEFNQALVNFINDKVSVRTKANELVAALAEAYRASTKTADEFMDSRGLPRLDYIHTVEPAQSHSYECKDLDGFTTTRGIWPPFARRTRRRSNTQKNVVVKFGDVEVATDFDPDFNLILSDNYYRFMKIVGRPHGISADDWGVATPDRFRWWIEELELPGKYYSESNTYKEQAALRKRAVVTDPIACSIANPGECAVCAE